MVDHLCWGAFPFCNCRWHPPHRVEALWIWPDHFSLLLEAVRVEHDHCPCWKRCPMHAHLLSNLLDHILRERGREPVLLADHGAHQWRFVWWHGLHCQLVEQHLLDLW